MKTKFVYIEPVESKGVTTSATYVDNLWLFGIANILDSDFIRYRSAIIFLHLFTDKYLVKK